ncbi:hypothetical protein pipiens_016741 [Culex pipiens pipiens]|uniref:Uncharacterized protein n=1 Tax=Culex pipiens pipiens TaxID=38569 RepID=A0ABD1CL78_CULPP
MRGAQQRNGTGRVDRLTHRSSRVGPTRSTSVSGIALRGCREQPGEPELAGQVREGGRSPRQPAPVSAHVRGTNQVDLRLKASTRKGRGADFDGSRNGVGAAPLRPEHPWLGTSHDFFATLLTISVLVGAVGRLVLWVLPRWVVVATSGRRRRVYPRLTVAASTRQVSTWSPGVAGGPGIESGPRVGWVLRDVAPELVGEEQRVLTSNPRP